MKWGLVPAFAKRAEDFDVFKGGSSTFNARVEGLDSSGLWRRLLASHRGVVLLDGFYEWKAIGKAKVPIFIRNRDDYDGHVMRPPANDPGEKPLDLDNGAEVGTVDSPVLPVQAASQAGATSPAQAGPAHAPLMLAALFDTWRPHDTKPGDAGADECLETVAIVTMESAGTPFAQVHDRMPVFLTPETAATWLDSSVIYEKAVGPILRTAQQHAKEQLCMYEVSSLVSNVKNESPDCVLPKKEMDAKQFSKGLGMFFTKKVAQEPTPAKRKTEDEQVQASCTLQPPGKVQVPTPAKRKTDDEQALASGISHPPGKVSRTDRAEVARTARAEVIVLD